ncbi:MAG: septum site-determining protein MinC [bacterium]
MSITIKGERNYLVIKIDKPIDSEDLDNFRNQMVKNRDFLSKGKVLIKYAGESISLEEVQELVSAIGELEEIKILGLLTETTIPKDEGGAIVIRKTLRSGQSISYNGDVVIFGDVNAGAEVIAEGDIIVIGALRGVVHAGAMGNRDAIIYALEFSPTQVRIADVIARAPEKIKGEVAPEIARIKENSIIIETITHGGIR